MILRYTLPEAGSGRIVIGCDEKLVTAPVSRAHDSLRDLLAGTLAILEGSSQVAVVFMDEPGAGERHLNIRRLDGPGRIALQVIWHTGWNRTGSKKELRLSCGTTTWELREQVVASCEAIVETLGAGGYAREWGTHEFPLAMLERLRAMDLRVRFAEGELALECCGQRIRMRASSLYELVSAESALLAGKREATVIFTDDERRHYLKLRRVESDRIALEVTSFWRMSDNDFGAVAFACETRFEHFRRQLLAAAGQPAT